MVIIPFIRLSLGTELLLQKGGDMEVGLLSVGGAYKSENWEATAKLGMHAWNLTYLHKSSKVSLFHVTSNAKDYQ